MARRRRLPIWARRIFLFVLLPQLFLSLLWNHITALRWMHQTMRGQIPEMFWPDNSPSSVLQSHNNQGSSVTPSSIAPDALETTVACEGYCCHSLSENNRSCHYTNLYLEVTGDGQGQFWAFVVAGNEPPFSDKASLATATDTRPKCQGPFPPHVHSTRPDGFKPRTTACSTEYMSSSENYTGGFTSISTGPKVRVFATRAELQAHVASLAGLEKRPHVHVQFTGHSNWGHNTMEGMYAAWMATSKFGLENRTICFVRNAEQQQDALDPASTFGGCPAQSWEQLTAATTMPRWVHFEEWIFGISGAGMMHRTRHFEASLFKSEDDMISLPRLFRHRMFDRYSMKQPPSRVVSNERRHTGNSGSVVLLRALVVPNIRDWGDLTGIAAMINETLRHIELGGQLVTVVAHVLDWKTHGTLRQQLDMIGQTDIYISSVGTALTLQSFLPDGSVVVNVGWDNGFWDEYITAANRWLDAVYPSALDTKRSSEDVTALVRDAATKIIRGFNIPVPRGQALSSIGRAFSTFLRSEEGEQLHVWPMLNAQYQWDGSFGGLRASGSCRFVVGHAAAAYYWACGKFNARCHPSIVYMENLRRDHNIICYSRNASVPEGPTRGAFKRGAAPKGKIKGRKNAVIIN